MTAASVDTGAESSSATPAEGSTNNKVAGNLRDSVQAGVFNTINYYGAHDKVDLFARQHGFPSRRATWREVRRSRPGPCAPGPADQGRVVLLLFSALTYEGDTSI